MAKQKGFGMVEIVIAVLVVVVLGFIVWRVMDGQTNDTGQDQAGNVEQTVPAADDAAGLESTENFLNSTDVDAELSTKEIDAVIE